MIPVMRKFLTLFLRFYMYGLLGVQIFVTGARYLLMGHVAGSDNFGPGFSNAFAAIIWLIAGLVLSMVAAWMNISVRAKSGAVVLFGVISGLMFSLGVLVAGWVYFRGSFLIFPAVLYLASAYCLRVSSPKV